jgi:general stress protein YciG
MDNAKQRAIASKGGKAAHRKGTAHRFTTDEARIAGRKGGQAAHVRGTAHEFTSEEARAAGRKGGHAARERTKALVSGGEHPNADADTNQLDNTWAQASTGLITSPPASVAAQGDPAGPQPATAEPTAVSTASYP